MNSFLLWIPEILSFYIFILKNTYFKKIFLSTMNLKISMKCLCKTQLRSKINSRVFFHRVKMISYLMGKVLYKLQFLKCIFDMQGSYYVIRFGNSITNLYKKLGKNKRKIWGIVKVINGIVQFSFKNLKKIIIGSGSISLMQLLPLFPPIYVGFRVFFAAFWPKRILFFSAKQVCN